jgi:hypothetical protein
LLAAELGSRVLATVVFWGLGTVAAGLAVTAYLLPLPAAVAVTVAAFACVALAALRPTVQLRRARSYVG